MGGTDFASRNVIGEEKAWSQGGGGFSDTFAPPAYQEAAVRGYLASGVPLPNASLFNASGRGYPDVSALGGQQNPYCVTVGWLPRPHMAHCHAVHFSPGAPLRPSTMCGTGTPPLPLPRLPHRWLLMGVAGTSASTPVVAAMVARLNELRLAKGASPLGFANPFL